MQFAVHGTAKDVNAFSYLQETSLRQPTQHIILPPRDLDEIRTNPVHARPETSRLSVRQLVLCLSRACLGKYSIVQHEQCHRKKHQRCRTSVRPDAENAPLILSAFPSYVCPEPVLVK